MATSATRARCGAGAHTAQSTHLAELGRGLYAALEPVERGVVVPQIGAFLAAATTRHGRRAVGRGQRLQRVQRGMLEQRVERARREVRLRGGESAQRRGVLGSSRWTGPRAVGRGGDGLHGGRAAAAASGGAPAGVGGVAMGMLEER